MPEQDFIFVNKNPQSQHLTRAHGPERSLVFSHVRQSASMRKRGSAQTTFALSGAPHADDTTSRWDQDSRLKVTKNRLSPMTVFQDVLRQRGIQSNLGDREDQSSIERALPLFNVEDPKIHPYVDVLLTFCEPIGMRRFLHELMTTQTVALWNRVFFRWNLWQAS